MKKFLQTAGLSVAALFLLPNVADAALSTPTITPTPNNTAYDPEGELHYMLGQLNQIVLEWPGSDLVWGSSPKIEIENWYDWSTETLTQDSDYFIEGSKLYINVDFKYTNYYDVKVYANTVKDDITGQSNAYVNNLSYNISPVELTKDDLVTDPMYGQEFEKLGPTIVVTAPGWKLEPYDASTTIYRVRFGKGKTSSDMPTFDDIDNSTIQSAVIENNQLTITLKKQYTDIGWYGLGLNYNLFDASKGDYQNVDMQEETIVYFHITGYTAVPANMTTYVGPFSSFTIYGTDISVKNASNIKIKAKDLEEEDPAAVEQSFTYETVNDDNGQGIKFTLDKTIEYISGDIEVTIPAGALSIGGSNNSAITLNYYQKMELPEAVSTTAETPEILNGLSQIVLNWANNTPLQLNNGNATLQLGEEDPVQVSAYAKLNNVLGQNQDTDQDIVVSSELVFDFSSTPIVTPGTYTLSIPDGFVTATSYKQKNTAQTFQYTVSSSKVENYTVSPQPGTVEELSSVTFTWEDLTDQTLTYNTVMKYQNITVTVGGQAYEGEIQKNINGNSFTVTFPEPIKTEGAFVISIPEGYLGCVTDAAAFYAGAAEASYTIGTPKADIGTLEEEPTVDPKDGSTIETIQSINVTWGMDLESNAFCEASVTVNGEEWTGVVVEGQNLTINLRRLTEGSEVTVVLPADFIIATDEDGAQYYNQELSLTYKVASPVIEPEYMADPVVNPQAVEGKVAPFQTVTLAWSDYTLSLNEDCEESATFDGIEVEGAIEENALVFTVDALKDGSYSLVVPAQYVIGTDEEGNEYFNQSGNYVFVVDGSVGVKVIGSELNGNEAIFNLNGVRVNGNNLNKGIYIINGKKVVVK